MDAYLNVMTEDRAKEKWCCNKIDYRCCASSCMAWRWQPLYADDAFKAAVKKRMNDVSENHVKAASYVAENRSEFGLPTEPYLGFCGLAGG